MMRGRERERKVVKQTLFKYRNSYVHEMVTFPDCLGSGGVSANTALILMKSGFSCDVCDWIMNSHMP